MNMTHWGGERERENEKLLDNQYFQRKPECDLEVTHQGITSTLNGQATDFVISLPQYAFYQLPRPS
jgi:hypothetical protein